MVSILCSNVNGYILGENNSCYVHLLLPFSIMFNYLRKQVAPLGSCQNVRGFKKEKKRKKRNDFFLTHLWQEVFLLNYNGSCQNKKR